MWSRHWHRIGTDVILEFTGVGKRSSHVSCLADLIFPIQFRSAAATETHTELTQALTFCITTLDTSQMLYSYAFLLKTQPSSRPSFYFLCALAVWTEPASATAPPEESTGLPRAAADKQ